MGTLEEMLGRKVYTTHRLDKPTSGVLVFTFSSEVARSLCEAFAKGQVKRSYLALVRGFTPQHEIIDYPLKDVFDKLVHNHKDKERPPREAVTELELIATTEVDIPVRPYPTARYSLVKLMPQTGRNRQLRRHLKHIFHPIVGDHKHGDNHHNKMLTKHFGLNRLMLHAQKLEVMHPTTLTPLVLEAEPQENFKNLLEKINIFY